MQSGITSQRFNNRTSTTSILTRRKMISRLTFAKNFCQIIGWDQPSVVGARTYRMESSQMRVFYHKYRICEIKFYFWHSKVQKCSKHNFILKKALFDLIPTLCINSIAFLRFVPKYESLFFIANTFCSTLELEKNILENLIQRFCQI